jgi:DNA primase
VSVYTIPGFGVVQEEHEENGRHGMESVCICPNPECPSRDKKKAKFYVNKGDHAGAFHCWSCGIEGRVKGEVKRTEARKIEYAASEIIHECIGEFVKTLELTDELAKYAKDTWGISTKVLENWNIGISRARPNYSNVDNAVKVGLLNKTKGKIRNRFWKRIICPMRNGDRWVFLQGRAMADLNGAKFLNIHSNPPLVNIDAIKDEKEVYLCEGWPDMLSMISHGYENSIAILGAGNFQDSYIKILKDKKVLLALDADSAGDKGRVKIERKFEDNEIEYSIVKLPEGMDIAEHLKGGGKVEKIEPRRGLVYIRSGQNLIVFGYGSGKSSYDVVIGVRDIIERRQQLKVKLEIQYKRGEIYKGIVDLANIRARALFANAANDFNKQIDKRTMKEVLNDLYTGVTQQLEERRIDKVEAAQYVPSEEEKEAAMKFLKSDKLLFKIKKYLRRQQIVGEDRNKLLLYLIFTSRLMPKPISAIIKGLSSSGKTYLMSRTMTLIPPEDLFVIQEATSKAFYYLGENDLMHKMIVIGEMHGTEDSEYAIREAQDGISDGDLRITTVQKDPDTNQMSTVVRTVRGPCGFVTSTTNPELNPENETRSFSIHINVNEEKIRETGVVVEEIYTGVDKSLKKEEAITLHNVQRMLEKNVRVRVPYVRIILDSFPTSHARVMRDRMRFFTILETVSIFHQFQPGREVKVDDDGNKHIMANLSDYNIVKCLLNEILAETLYELPPKSKEIYAKVVQRKTEWLESGGPKHVFDPDYNEEDPGLFTITYKEIAELMGMRKDEVVRWTKPLREQGYFGYHDIGGGRGKETHLIPVDKEFYESFLPTPEEVAEKHPEYYGESIYDPLTGEERVIVRLENEEIEI